MARTAITINTLPAAGGGPTTNTLTTIDQTNGMYIDAGGHLGDMMVVVRNASTTTAYDVYVLPGDNPPALRAGLGTLTEEIAAGEFEALFIEGARHCQDDGKIHLDFESGLSGKIAAYRMPVGVS
jgi:hypothetical protein